VVSDFYGWPLRYAEKEELDSVCGSSLKNDVMKA